MCQTHPIQKFLCLTMMLFLVFIAIPVQAGDPSAKPLELRIETGPDLADILNFAYQTSPLIEAARSAWQESLERYQVDTAYPDPELLMTYWPQSMADDLDKKKFEAMISQTIPFPGLLTAAGEATKAQSAIKRYDLDLTIRETIITIRESFHELLYIRKARTIAGANQTIIEQIRALGETAYADNRSALIDVMKAQAQAAQNTYDIALLDELEKTEKTRLNALINRSPDAPIGPLKDDPSKPLVFSLEDIFSMAAKNREENKIADSEIKKSEAEAKVARFETFPQFKFGLIYESVQPEPSDASSQDSYAVQFGMTLPVRFDKNSGKINASKALVKKTKSMAAARQNETGALVRENYFRLKNAERLVFLYRDKLIPQAAKSLETAEIWNKTGQSSLTDYLEIQSVWYNFQLALARANADYGKYLARLEGLAGQTLTVKSESLPVQNKEKL